MKKGLNANIIKFIAIIAMTIDHIAWAVFPGYPHEIIPLILHLIGRITCPIMCYFVAEGYYRTRNVNKYASRLFIFAFIAHFAYVLTAANYVDWHSFIPFYYGSVLNQTSVMWALAWGLIMLRVANSAKIKTQAAKVALILLICVVSLPSDWSCVASLCVMAFGTSRGNVKKQAAYLIFYVALYALIYFFAIDKIYGLLQMGVVLSLPILKAYNGLKGKNPTLNKIAKPFFYLYYPLHLFIIAILERL